ncbi:KGK domain-containing protein [Nostoc sp.]|uniref:KGK domain-containing protein n=1 Tax=Nostoc sp. TaxID=1180 RepID=UPI002FFBCC76
MIDLDDNDVLSMSSPTFETGSTFKVSELKAKVREFANIENQGTGYMNPKVKWFSDAGVECEVLRLDGGGWQKGRLRFHLEFIPDEPIQSQLLIPSEPKSPLDDMRSQLNPE